MTPWPPPGPGVPPEPDSLRPEPPPASRVPSAQQPDAPALPAASGSELRWVEVPAPESYAHDLLAAPPPKAQPASGPPRTDQASEPSWVAPAGEAEVATDRLTWTDRAALAPAPTDTDPGIGPTAQSPPAAGPDQAGPVAAERPAWMREDSGSELFEPITVEPGEPLWPKPATQALERDHIFPPGYVRPIEQAEPPWGPSVDYVPEPPVEEEPRWAPQDDFAPEPGPEPIPVDLPVEEELRWGPSVDYVPEPSPDQTPLGDDQQWGPRFSPPPDQSPAAPAEPEPGPAAHDELWSPNPELALPPEQASKAAEAVWATPSPHPTAAARELLATSSAATQADPFDLFGDQDSPVDQSDDWLNDPALAVIGDHGATQPSTQVDQAAASDTPITSEPELEAELEAELEPEAAPSQAQVIEPPAPASQVAEAGVPEAGGHSRNPWVGILWVVAVACLIAGLALSEWATSVPTVISSTLANLGAWGMVGAFVMTGIDRRLRRRH